MKTNPRSTTRSLVLAALFLALAFVLPMVTGHVPQVVERGLVFIKKLPPFAR